MGEACRIAQVPAHVLRYWEKHFGALRPSRRSSGHRRYSRTDLETIFEIKDLVQRRRMTVAGARKALLDRKRGAAETPRAQEPGGASPAVAKAVREMKKEIAAILKELS